MPGKWRGQASWLSVDNDAMPAKGDRNWPDHEVNEFLDQITAGGQDYRRLVERLPVIVYTSEMGEHGEWYYVSPQVEKILGYTAEELKADRVLWARLLHPDDRKAALANETESYLGDRSSRPVEYRLCTRTGGVVWMLDEAVLEADEEGVPVWHGVLYDITERKQTEAELQRALAQQAVVAKLGERALQDGDPEALMRAVTTLIGEVDGVHSACIWELGRDGRRVSAARDSHSGAALDSGAPTIVEDWQSETRFTMPPVLRVFGAASSLAVMIDGKEHPFGVLDVHATEPHRFSLK